MTRGDEIDDDTRGRFLITWLFSISGALLAFFALSKHGYLTDHRTFSAVIVLAFLLAPLVILKALTGDLSGIRVPQVFEVSFDDTQGPTERRTTVDHGRAEDADDSAGTTPATRPTDDRSHHTVRRSVLRAGALVAVIGIGAAAVWSSSDGQGDNGGTHTSDGGSGNGDGDDSGGGGDGGDGTGDDGTATTDSGGGDSPTEHDSEPTLQSSVIIDGIGEEPKPGTWYTVEVGGQLEQITEADGTVEVTDDRGETGQLTVTDNDDETVGESRADGRVGPHADGYRFHGGLTALSLTDYDEATVYLNGRQVDPTALEVRRPIPRTLVVTGCGEYVEYSFEVSGALRQVAGPIEGFDASKDVDRVSDGRVEGAVTEGADGFRFDGEIVDFSTDQPDALSVYVDEDYRDPERITVSDVTSAACR